MRMPSSANGILDDDESLTNSKPRTGPMLSSAQRQPTISPPDSHGLRPDIKDAACVEGDSSLAAHSEFASEFLQNFMRTESLQDSSLDVSETLKALSQIVQALKQQSLTGSAAYPHARLINKPQLQTLKLPPIDKAVHVIRTAEDLCLEVYYSESYSEYDFIAVNGGLYSLFVDCAAQVSADEREEYHEYAR
ncbi:uncharacterized protein ColSpa_12095 [Colletotrichum spaethianum]|uniref:Uncharacterized protein n=1 Tax=Colletotrichum spaethianum TaxID=700344 RepID=A0AA37UKX5_9PEZI|nr:uncharacterized protein ColSpa_12095 [Colletotrichum spaethianum]GKT51914.1 hypothetical protein ColSpa_12095 [Colletotrichum spaethianum]